MGPSAGRLPPSGGVLCVEAVGEKSRGPRRDAQRPSQRCPEALAEMPGKMLQYDGVLRGQGASPRRSVMCRVRRVGSRQQLRAQGSHLVPGPGRAGHQHLLLLLLLLLRLRRPLTTGRRLHVQYLPAEEARALT